MGKLIELQAAIEAFHNATADGDKAEWCVSVIQGLPSAQPEIVMCKDCRKHNVSVGYKEDCCALIDWRGVSYGHEHDYQFCCHGKRRRADD